jgi:hypothetical protein
MQGHTQLSRRNKQLHDFSVAATAYSSYALYNSDKYSTISHLRAPASGGPVSPVGAPLREPPTPGNIQFKHAIDRAQGHRATPECYVSPVQQCAYKRSLTHHTHCFKDTHTLRLIAPASLQIVPPTPASKLHPVSTHLDLVLKHGAQHGAGGGSVLLVDLVQAGLDLTHLLWVTSTGGKYGVSHCAHVLAGFTSSIAYLNEMA